MAAYGRRPSSCSCSMIFFDTSSSGCRAGASAASGSAVAVVDRCGHDRHHVNVGRALRK